MDCRLCVSKPLPEPVIVDYQFDGQNGWIIFTYNFCSYLKQFIDTNCLTDIDVFEKNICNWIIVCCGFLKIWKNSWREKCIYFVTGYLSLKKLPNIFITDKVEASITMTRCNMTLPCPISAYQIMLNIITDTPYTHDNIIAVVFFLALWKAKCDPKDMQHGPRIETNDIWWTFAFYKP